MGVLIGFLVFAGLSYSEFENPQSSHLRPFLGDEVLTEQMLTERAAQLEQLPFSEAGEALSQASVLRLQAEELGAASLTLPLIRIWYRFSHTPEDIEAGLSNTESLLLRFQQQLDVRSLETAEIFRALFLTDLSRYVEALSVLEKLIENSRTPATIAVAQANVARIASNTGRFAQAVEAGLEAIIYYQSTGDKRTLFNLYHNLSGTYAAMHDYSRSLEAAQTAYRYALDLSDPQLISDAYLALGTSWHRQGNPETAIEMLLKSRDLATGPGMQLRLAQVLLNLGNVYQSMENHGEAVTYYRQAETLSLALQQPFGIALSRYNLAISLQKTGRYVEAIQQYLGAAPFFEQSGNIAKLKLLNEGLAQSHAALGDWQQAWEHQQRYLEFFRQVYDQENQRILSEAQTRFETRLREQELASVLELSGQQHKQIRLQRALMALLLLGVACGIAFFIYRERSLVQLYQRSAELLQQTPKKTELLSPGAKTAVQILSDGTGKEDDPVNDETGQENKLYFRLYSDLVQALEQGKLYTDENLTVKEAAKFLQTNEKYLSTAISKCSNTNFSGLINFWRILEARRLLLLHGEKMPVQEIMERCGYRSTTTFYNAFKKYTGMTPGQFIAISQKEKAHS